MSGGENLAIAGSAMTVVPANTVTRLTDRLIKAPEVSLSPQSSGSPMAQEPDSLKAGLPMTLEQRATDAFNRFAILMQAEIELMREEIEEDRTDNFVSGFHGKNLGKYVYKEFPGAEFNNLRDVLRDSFMSVIAVLNYDADSKFPDKDRSLAVLTKMSKNVNEIRKLAAAGKLLEIEKARVRSGFIHASRVLKTSTPVSSSLKGEGEFGGIDFRSLPIVT